MAGRIMPRPQRARVLPALRALAKDGVVRASSREVAALAGVSHWTAQEAIVDLECNGHIETVEPGGRYRMGLKGRTRGVYRLVRP